MRVPWYFTRESACSHATGNVVHANTRRELRVLVSCLLACKSAVINERYCNTLTKNEKPVGKIEISDPDLLRTYQITPVN